MRNPFCTVSHGAFAILLVGNVAGQEMENRQVVVQAEGGELPSAYGAPPDLSHGRISSNSKLDTKAIFSVTG